ncbi:MAG: type II secretion system protein J [Candidatus Bruticola sp.]
MNTLNVSRRNTLGATLIEVLVTTGVFSVLMLVLFSVVQYGMDSWNSIEGRTVTQTMMRKVGVFAMDDIRRTSFGGIALASYSQYNPGTLSVIEGVNNDAGAAKYGQAIWMLSAYNDNSSISSSGPDPEVISAAERFRRGSNGVPEWSKNVIYYASVIGDELHKEKYHGTVSEVCGDADSCPHKWLIRCEVKGSSLLSSGGGGNIQDYIVKPEKTGKGVNIFTDDKFKSSDCKVQVLADCIVAFRVITKKPEVTLVIKSARLAELRRAAQQQGVKMGGRKENTSVSETDNMQALKNLDTLTEATNRLGAYTLQYDITVIPRNNME